MTDNRSLDDIHQFQTDLEQSSDELIEPNAEEIRNGWTTETLTAYVNEQRAARNVRINPRSKMRMARNPTRANSGYRVFEWQR